MEQGGMSIRPGGLTPGGQVQKDYLSELGPAKEADVTHLQGLKSDHPTPPSPTDTPAKPWDVQGTRIVDAALAAERHLGKTLIEYAQKLHAVSLNQAKEMKKKIEEVHLKGLTQVDAIELQVMSSEMLVFADAVSKAVGKIITGIQTIIKQQ